MSKDGTLLLSKSDNMNNFLAKGIHLSLNLTLIHYYLPLNLFVYKDMGISKVGISSKSF